MATISTPKSQHAEDKEIWQSLKLAIANSSGFKRWQEAKSFQSSQSMSIDSQVKLYLKETLNTLAY
ncbi:MAG: hypothetical protein D6756_06750 [Cyanobacteria bacterium J083]|nr:MAG: hypothetical protein D6756_06750 [Cyanobacteria bacterium J083]